MKRRDFSVGLAGFSVLPGLVLAQGGPIEGRQYQSLSQRLPVVPGKIEVVEFFWYGCPHCYAFEPVLEAWVKQLPPDVAFRRVHVGFRANIKLHQRLFYALEAMGRESELRPAIFNAFHRERLDLDDEKAIVALMSRLGVDAAKFKDAFNSFGVQSKSMQAGKLSEGYRIDGVPALGIAGRFLTAPSQAGTQGQSEVAQGQQALIVADFLIKRARNNS